jgi:hypothetical protein
MERIAMPHAELTHVARELACQTFAQLGLSSGTEPREAILVRNGAYCGRRFELDTACAVWLIDEDQLTIRASNGRVLQVIERVSVVPLPSRLAA